MSTVSKLEANNDVAVGVRAGGPASGPNAATPAAHERGAPIRGTHKALLLLMSLDESAATRILANLSLEDVAQLRRATEDFDQATPELLSAVQLEFIRLAGRNVASLRGSSAYLRRLAGKALGEGKVATVWADSKPAVAGVAALATLDVETIVGLVESEASQTIAVLLAQLPPEKAAEVLKRLPDTRRADIVLRMSRTETIAEAAMREIEDQVAEELRAVGSVDTMPVGGVTVAAGVLKRLDHDAANEVLTQVQSVDESASVALRKALFTFEDLVRIEGKGMQVLLKSVQTEQLVLALKTASDDLREKVFGNLSARAAGVMREELEMLGAVRLRDVESAQQAIVNVALELERDQKLTIAREGGNDYA